MSNDLPLGLSVADIAYGEKDLKPVFVLRLWNQRVMSWRAQIPRVDYLWSQVGTGYSGGQIADPGIIWKV